MSVDINEHFKIVAEVNGLVGYASTCRTTNLPQWMEGFEVYLNRVLDALGDTDRVKFDGDTFQRKATGDE